MAASEREDCAENARDEEQRQQLPVMLSKMFWVHRPFETALYRDPCKITSSRCQIKQTAEPVVAAVYQFVHDFPSEDATQHCTGSFVMKDESIQVPTKLLQASTRGPLLAYWRCLSNILEFTAWIDVSLFNEFPEDASIWGKF